MTVNPTSAASQQVYGANPADSSQAHTVQRGETLSQIAQRYGVSLSDLIAANRQIANPDLIYPDQLIHVPGGAAGHDGQPGGAIGGDNTPAATVVTAASDSTYTGDALSRVQLAQLFHQAGFSGDNLVAMVAIAMRESGGDPRAFNGNTGTRDLSYGLTQINMLGSLGPARREQLGLVSNEQLFDPLTNARAAFIISGNGTDLSPWGGYKGMSNTYGTDMDAARAAVQQAQAQGLLGQPFQNGPGADPAPAPVSTQTSAANSAAAMPTLRIGARGEAVAELQRQLQAAGFSPGPVDGWFGAQTQAAVRQFQASRGIAVDGWVGPQTWGRLLGSGESTPPDNAAAMPTLRIGARGEAVAELQRQLQAAGFSPGPVDGWFGAQTQAAVRQFQASRGIAVDGWVGPQTWGELQDGSTAPAPTGGRLVRGASGAHVRELQQLLQTAGYYHANIGGNFGPQTDAAVRSFQRDHGLVVDGWAGPQTMAALRQAVQGGGTPPPATPPVTGAPNARVQAALDFGLSQLGTPYVGGGSPFRFGDPGNGKWYQMPGQNAYLSPEGVRGFDCSGLVVAMYRQAGVDLNARGIANTRTMEASLSAVSKDQLQPGDLLVKGGSHVVIYLGDGRVLESTPPSTRISDASTFLNNPDYVGRRVPPEWYA